MNEGGDVLRDRDLVDGLILDECCLLDGGDSDRDLMKNDEEFM